MSNQVTRITTQPGVKRDGTVLDSQFYREMKWTRIVNGKPRKMGGYRNMAQFTAPIRAVHTYKTPSENLIHVFGTSSVEAVLVDNNGGGSAVYDRTPTSFVANDFYTWTFGTAYDMTGSGQTRIYAHASTSDNTPTPIFYGDIEATTPLTPIELADTTRPATTGTINNGSTSLTLASATGFAIGDMISIAGAGTLGVDVYTSITNLAGVTATLRDYADTSVVGAAVKHILGTDGGIVPLGPYLFYYGSNGLIANTDLNNPTLAYSGDANMVNPIGSKVRYGLAIRGGGQSPAGIFFSDDSVVKASFVGGTLLFQYDIVTSQSSLLNGNTVVEYDGVYYWLGLDRAQMFNNGVREIPNPFNNQWFYDNLNMDYAYKVWGTKVPRYGEIWWFFPTLDSTECNWALIYNIRENAWYDTPISRSGGYYTQTFPYPVWGDEDGNLWQHEFNWDYINGDQVLALESYFITHDIGMPTGGATQEQPQGANAWTRLERIEPDFAQTGEMTVEVLSKEYANSDEVSLGVFPFTESDVRVDMRAQARILALKFRSAAQGGSFWMGVTLMHLDPGDRRE